ncbi:MAG: pentapeptide repeat-containing protein, partial [bacterium]
MRLTSETIEDVLDLVLVEAERSLDLSDVGSIDAYALLLLDLVVRHARESGAPFRVTWPESPSVRRWMTAMHFFVDVKAGLASRPAEESTVWQEATCGSAAGACALGASTLAPMVSIDREEDVSRLVGSFDERLSARYPIDESPRRRFLRILLELFQNIPQHANATGDVLDPHGIAAMHDDGHSIVLAIADKGIGLARSLRLRLGLRPGSSEQASLGQASLAQSRLAQTSLEQSNLAQAGLEQACLGQACLSDADALRAVVFDGRSRFRDPGRGHELERIFRLVRSWEGTVVVRSGSALLYQSEAGGDVVDVVPFPGVQIALSIP